MIEELPTTASDAGADGVVDALGDFVEPEGVAVVRRAGRPARLRGERRR